MSRIHQTVAISLHPELRAAAQGRAEELGFRNSFSAYVAKLIAEDVRQADSAKDAPLSPEQAADVVVRTAAAQSVSYAAKPAKPKTPRSSKSSP